MINNPIHKYIHVCPQANHRERKAIKFREREREREGGERARERERLCLGSSFVSPNQFLQNHSLCLSPISVKFSSFCLVLVFFIFYFFILQFSSMAAIGHNNLNAKLVT